uniref:F-box protein FBW2 n=1 Tax=Vitis vinifera TaxID=29760 RepID=A5BTP9_VITVI|nr:hypothetical protein VITISV_007693 [Vitis vinifera]
MEERKWEELNMDILVNVFGRVGMESLLLDVPFVCKPWYKASREPQCWGHLIFPEYIKPDDIWEEDSPDRGFAERCPILKVLDVGLYNSSIKHIIPKFVSKWKSLERMRIGKFHVKSVLRLLPQIGLHCNNFIWLSAPYSYIRKDEALGIVASLPKLKYLDLHGADFEKEAVVMILQGCKQLVHLDIRDCRGFRGDDAEILELASHIPSFMCEGSSIGLGELSAFVYNREVAREVEHELFCDKICHDDCVYAFHFDFDDLLI